MAASLRDVRVVHGSTLALDVVELDLPVGSTIAVIGPNGAGKSTLLGLLSGLIEPVRGRIEVLGGPAGAGRGRVAHVFQETAANAALPLTVLEVVRMGRYARLGPLARPRTADHEAVARAMERTAIIDLAGRHLTELSAGQRQRVYLAQGLAQEAELLLLDEPVTGLDLPARERIHDVLADEREAGRTVVVTTHDVAEAATADHVVLLARRVVAAGPAAAVLRTDNLAAAYGSQVHVTDRGTMILDDPHAHPHP